MGDAAGDAGIITGGLCCICCTESLEQWCLFNNAWGSGSGTGHQAGCCTRCCKRSFDEDEFGEEQERLQQMRAARLKREQAAASGLPSDSGQQKAVDGSDVVQNQPEARKSMEASRTEGGDQPKPE
ncbi:hypothetical protein PsYK624_147190 [Phanerochaete sordida]|uniref:Uncharacterized protein n=1 Tax=Phanerochaete sordida TaxID=48140 RepID=A0A9P3LLN4_9APHY|nr:hypothetical protein PsYK624_147190 [Phanerochaete sordida]